MRATRGSTSGSATIASSDFTHPTLSSSELSERFCEKFEEDAARYWSDVDPELKASSIVEEYAPLLSRSEKQHYVESIVSMWEEEPLSEILANREADKVIAGESTIERVENADYDEATFEDEVTTLARDVLAVRSQPTRGAGDYSRFNGADLVDEATGAVSPLALRSHSETQLSDDQWLELSASIEETIDASLWDEDAGFTMDTLHEKQPYADTIRALASDPATHENNRVEQYVDHEFMVGDMEPRYQLERIIRHDLSTLGARTIHDFFHQKFGVNIVDDNVRFG